MLILGSFRAWKDVYLNADKTQKIRLFIESASPGERQTLAAPLAELKTTDIDAWSVEVGVAIGKRCIKDWDGAAIGTCDEQGTIVPAPCTPDYIEALMRDEMYGMAAFNAINEVNQRFADAVVAAGNALGPASSGNDAVALTH